MNTVTTQQTVHDRRVWPRFKKSVRVLLLPDDCGLDEPYAGWIVDVSCGGLCLRKAGVAFDPGAVVRLRPLDRRKGWTSVRVKHCRRQGESWELGCEFVQKNRLVPRVAAAVPA